MSKVSARSAETVLALSKKSTAHKEALIEIADEIKKGAGSVRIEKLLNEILNNEFNKQEDIISPLLKQQNIILLALYQVN